MIAPNATNGERGAAGTGGGSVGGADCAIGAVLPGSKHVRRPALPRAERLAPDREGARKRLELSEGSPHVRLVRPDRRDAQLRVKVCPEDGVQRADSTGQLQGGSELFL